MNARGARGLTVASLLALLACTRSSASSSASPSGAEAVGPYRGSDMAAIQLAPRDAPAGLGYVPAYSGDQDIVSFARDATEEQKLVEDGFEFANGVVFVPADRVGGGKLTPRDPIVQTILVVFSRGSGASSTLQRYLADLRDRQLPGATAGSAPALGDEAYRLDGANADGSAVTAIAWRRANLVLVVLGTSIAPTRTVGLADLMDTRAEAAQPATGPSSSAGS